MKLLIGLIAVAVIAIGVYIGVVVNKNNQAKKFQEDEQKKVMFSFDPMDITDMSIHNSSGDYSFELTDSGWVITEGDQFQLSADRFVTIAETMSSLTASKILSEELPDDLDAYGLENPMKLTFTLKNNDVCSIDIGSKVPGDTSYYVRADGKDIIYMVSESDIENLSVEIADIKDKFLFNAGATSDIIYLKYTDHGSIIYDIQKENNVWNMIAPFSKGRVNGADVDSITSLLIRAESAAFVDEELTDASKFGFDNPSYQIEVKTAEKDAKVFFGNYYDENQQYIYAYNQAIDQIYIFETASLGFIDTKTEDVLENRLHNEAFGNIDKFEMNIFGTEINIDFRYNVAGETTSYYVVNGKEVDRENEQILETFNNLINAITGVSFDYICENTVDDSELETEPAVTIVYRLKEGEDYSLSLIPKSDDDSLMYIMENNTFTETVLRKKSIENGIMMYYTELMGLIS